MPYAKIADGRIRYEMLGTGSQCIALTPGGRGGMEGMRPIAEQLVTEGYRVLIHDRRNSGASDLLLSGEDWEQAIWGDHLYELLGQEGALPAIVGGSSGGCRMSLLMALRHPEAVCGLLLSQVTDGSASAHVAGVYYGPFIEAAEKGGMEAVSATPYFSERIAQNPAAREQLLTTKVEDFIRVFSRWHAHCLIWERHPVMGCRVDDLRTISIPACIVPGSDDVHTRAAGGTLAKLLTDAELHQLYTEAESKALAGLSEEESLRDRRQRLGKTYIDFLRRRFPL
jgi:pimeloyl-ACP methyl ester carboxylesterase